MLHNLVAINVMAMTVKNKTKKQNIIPFEVFF